MKTARGFNQHGELHHGERYAVTRLEGTHQGVPVKASSGQED